MSRCPARSEHDLTTTLHQHSLPSLLQTPVHASLPITTTQLTEAPPDSPHSSKRFACAFSSTALKACSSAPHVAPLPPRHIHSRLKRVSSTFPKLLKSCFCTVSFGMERKVQTAFQLSPTLGRTSARRCASLGTDRRKSERGRDHTQCMHMNRWRLHTGLMCSHHRHTLMSLRSQLHASDLPCL